MDGQTLLRILIGRLLSGIRCSQLLRCQVTALRSRYCHTRQVIYRPDLCTALPHPSDVTSEYIRGIVTCLHWPISQAPTCQRRRLIPGVFLWTQNLLGVLVILWLTNMDPVLARIRRDLCGPQFGLEVAETARPALARIESSKDVDHVTRWA